MNGGPLRLSTTKLRFAIRTLVVGALIVSGPMLLARQAVRQPRVNQPAQATDPDLVIFQASSRVSVSEGIPFATFGASELKLDLFRPASPSQMLMPAVVVIPGGGWTGDRRNLYNFCGALAERGVVAACIDHRPIADYGFPAPVEDARTALRWLYVNATTHRVDVNQIGIVGTSSGGQVALIAGLSDIGRPLNADVAMPKISAVIGLAAPTDLRTLPPGNLRSAARFLRTAPGHNETIWAQGSAIDQIDRADPPVLLLQGELDEAVPIAQIIAFRDKAKQIGASVDLVIMRGGPHPFWSYRPWHERAVETIVQFLQDHRRRTR